LAGNAVLSFSEGSGGFEVLSDLLGCILVKETFDDFTSEFPSGDFGPSL
jgi:hypothetical protein